MLLFTKVLTRVHATVAYVFANQYMIALIDITRHIWDLAIHSPYAKCQIPEAFCTLDMCYESNICLVEKTSVWDNVITLVGEEGLPSGKVV